MLKQALIFIILSILVVVFNSIAHTVIVYIDMFYTYINLQLLPIFSHNHTGVAIRKIILLVLIPVVIAGIPALIYRFLKGKAMPHFFALTWCIWLVLVLCTVLIH